MNGTGGPSWTVTLRHASGGRPLMRVGVRNAAHRHLAEAEGLARLAMARRAFALARNVPPSEAPVTTKVERRTRFLRKWNRWLLNPKMLVGELEGNVATGKPETGELASLALLILLEREEILHPGMLLAACASPRDAGSETAVIKPTTFRSAVPGYAPKRDPDLAIQLEAIGLWHLACGGRPAPKGLDPLSDFAGAEARWPGREILARLTVPASATARAAIAASLRRSLPNDLRDAIGKVAGQSETIGDATTSTNTPPCENRERKPFPT